MFKPEKETEWTVLSLGAGVQSSAMALMAAKGEITPIPDFAVFADTQAEPTEVYEWLDWLEDQLPFPVYRVTKGDLTADSLEIRTATGKGKKKEGDTYLRRLIPVFGVMPDGKQVAAIGRKCTADYKILPINKFTKQKCGIERGQTECTVTQWIGISLDEIQRMKLPPHKWIQNRWPLLEKRITRGQCIQWMRNNGYPDPPRSACYYCPFHSDSEWRRLRDDDPDHFRKAVVFDNALRNKFKKYDSYTEMEVYLHRSCKPLSEIDFDNDKDKGQMTWDFQDECDGMCGV